VFQEIKYKVSSERLVEACKILWCGCIVIIVVSYMESNGTVCNNFFLELTIPVNCSSILTSRI
jgi:hypothetical protein